jgi:asparagine synthase (glutamine-hydrolysing)
MISINIKENTFWKKFIIKDVNLWIKGYIYSHRMEEIIDICESIKLDEISSFINSIDGHFSLVVQKEDLTFMAVDKIRSTPLFFTQIENSLFIDNNPKNLINLNGFNNTMKEDSKLEVSMAGYTIGNKTVYNNLCSLKAGEVVVFENTSFKYIQYYKYFGEVEEKSYEEYIKELSDVTLSIFKKMLNQIGNKQIIVPLSAGNDSRLVVSALKHLGAKNVKCYSYGTPGNFEAGIAKIIAAKLGYEWKFIPLTHKSEKKFYASKEYKDYLKFCETYCSVPYIQSLSTIKYLKDMKWIDEDAVFINGNSGDFISGSHINKMMKSIEKLSSYEERKENILNNLIDKHFSLWGYLKTEENLSLIKKNLWNEITFACGDLREKKLDHLYYEYSEFIDRQSSYVISGQKAYEYYGHEWRMPLWDDEYLFFWQKVPAKFKINQKLYTDMLKKKNFGNVWDNDIPVNKETITPKWIVPLRFICKIPFGLFGTKGKDAWKNFEKSVFYYWMDVTHMSDTTSYLRMIGDIFKMPRSHVSWHTEDYLENMMKEE